MQRPFLRNAVRNRRCNMGLRALAAEVLSRNQICDEGRNTPTAAVNAHPLATAALAEPAAVMGEEGATVPSEWIEGFAVLVSRPAPMGADPAKWIALLNAAGRFLVTWGARAAVLGWTAGELFGLDTQAPMGRLDRRGAAFFLAGVEVVAITADAITVRQGASVQRVYRRSTTGAAAWTQEHHGRGRQ